MTALQKAVLGTPPTGVDGDPVRTANTKFNANVDVLNAQIPLTSFATTLTAAQALNAANHLGKRVNINLAAAGTINLPAASTCVADGIILLRNLGTTVVTLAITAGSGDTLGMTTLNGLETCLFDTDGVHAWNVLTRGRGTTADETVQGNSTVKGNETVGGTLVVTGPSTLSSLSVTGASSFGSAGQASISAAGAYSGVGAAYTGQVSAAGGFAVPNNVGYRLTSTTGTAFSALYVDATNTVGVGNNTVPLSLIGSSVKVASTGGTVLDSTTGAPKPTTSGIGAVIGFLVGAGLAYSLPAGGTWQYFLMPFSNPGGTLGTGVGAAAGVAAGGTQVVGAIPGYSWTGFIWKIT